MERYHPVDQVVVVPAMVILEVVILVAVAVPTVAVPVAANLVVALSCGCCQSHCWFENATECHCTSKSPLRRAFSIGYTNILWH